MTASEAAHDDSCTGCHEAVRRYGNAGWATAFEARHAAAEALWREGLSPEERAVLDAHEAGTLVLG